MVMWIFIYAWSVKYQVSVVLGVRCVCLCLCLWFVFQISKFSKCKVFACCVLCFCVFVCCVACVRVVCGRDGRIGFVWGVGGREGGGGLLCFGWA